MNGLKLTKQKSDWETNGPNSPSVSHLWRDTFRIWKYYDLHCYSALHVRLEFKSHEKLFVLVVRDWCHAAGFRSGNCVVLLRTFAIMARWHTFEVWALNLSENGIGGRWSVAVVFLTRTEESGGAEEDSSNLIRAADYLDLLHIWNEYGTPVLKLSELGRGSLRYSVVYGFHLIPSVHVQIE